MVEIFQVGGVATASTAPTRRCVIRSTDGTGLLPVSPTRRAKDPRRVDPWWRLSRSTPLPLRGERGE